MSERVTVFRDGLLDGEHARAFAARQLAAVTHLPTGAAIDGSETLTIPAGSGTVTRLEAGATTLLHVATGQLRLLWGTELNQSATAGPGDTVAIPAGIAFRAVNASASEGLQVLLLRVD